MAYLKGFNHVFSLILILGMPSLGFSEEKKLFAAAEIAEHASKASCWLIIEDRVYDLTEYLPRHPAPPKAILDLCGKEATNAFRTKNKNKPHTARAWTMLSRYYIGDLQHKPS